MHPAKNGAGTWATRFTPSPPGSGDWRGAERGGREDASPASRSRAERRLRGLGLRGRGRSYPNGGHPWPRTPLAPPLSEVFTSGTQRADAPQVGVARPLCYRCPCCDGSCPSLSASSDRARPNPLSGLIHFLHLVAPTLGVVSGCVKRGEAGHILMAGVLILRVWGTGGLSSEALGRLEPNAVPCPEDSVLQSSFSFAVGILRY